ncbi:NAD(P)H-dependent oxidoreductase subunit E [Moorellaceae bacterium AZ2]
METCQCEAKWEELEKIIDAHRGQPSALIEVLHQSQELVGYLPRNVEVAIADGLGLSLSQVYSVVSFYNHFTTKPKGKYQVSVCMGTACFVKGAPAILERLEKELGTKVGDTTADGRFTINQVRCLGCCALGPVMTVNLKAHGRLTPDIAMDILKEYQ